MLSSSINSLPESSRDVVSSRPAPLDLPSLPVDILYEIFAILVFELEISPFILSQISKRLRDIALQSPQLWSSIPHWNHTPSTPLSSVQNAVEHFISHSQQCSLSLDLVPTTRVRSALLSLIYKGEPSINQRITSLKVEAKVPGRSAGQDECALLWSPNFARLLPNLAVLELRNTAPYRSVYREYLQRQPSITAPASLTTFHVDGLRLFHFQWKHILSVALPNLQHLHLLACKTCLDPHELISEKDDMRVIDLPKLRSLHLSKMNYVWDMTLVTPQLESLQSDKSICMSRDLIKVLVPSPVLKSLRWTEYLSAKPGTYPHLWIQDAGLQGEVSTLTYGPFFQRLRHFLVADTPIEEFHFNFIGDASVLTSHLIQWLQGQRETSVQCPKLCLLDFTGTWVKNDSSAWDSNDTSSLEKLFDPLVRHQREQYGVELSVMWNGNFVVPPKM